MGNGTRIGAGLLLWFEMKIILKIKFSNNAPKTHLKIARQHDFAVVFCRIPRGGIESVFFGISPGQTTSVDVANLALSRTVLATPDWIDR